MKKLILLFLSFFMCTVNTVAETGHSSHYNECVSKAAGGTKAMQKCIQEETIKQEKRLHENYKRALQIEEVNTGARHALELAQQAWVDFKNKTCNYYNQKDGRIFVVMRDQCHLEMTMIQANHLQQLVERNIH